MKTEVVLLSILSMSCFIWGPTSVGYAQDVDQAEKKELDLLSKPESWFIAQIGPREVVDNQRLNAKLQYVYQQRRKAATERELAGKKVAPATDPEATAEGRKVMRMGADRSWTFRTKVTRDMAATVDYVVKGRGGDVPIRVYRPQVDEPGPLPVVVYFHGGGWIFGSIAASDRAVRLLANEARAIVISVDYRLAPEHPYPSAWDDAEDVWLWARANAASFAGDPTRLCVGGDSAGGNLAINVSMRQLAAGQPMPIYQLLYYPAVDMSSEYPSYTKFGKGFGLDVSFADYSQAQTFPNMDKTIPSISPIRAPSLSRMPATILVTAGFDILRDSGRAYAARLEKEGVSVLYLNYSTLGHSFLQMSGVVGDADRAATDSARVFGTALRSRRAP
jgi:acetyl esterase